MVRYALVTGANRGIGLEVCRQLTQQGFVVALGARDREKGERAAVQLADQGLQVQFQQLDVTDQHSIDAAKAVLDQAWGQLDVLVNNAASMYDTWQHALNADLDQVHQVLETNTFGPWRMVQAFVPLLRRSDHGRIVNVSSEAGSLASMGAAVRRPTTCPKQRSTP